MKVDIKIKHVKHLLKQYDAKNSKVSMHTYKNGYQEIPERILNKCYFNCKKHNNGYSILIDQGLFDTQVFVHEFFVEKELNIELDSIYYI